MHWQILWRVIWKRIQEHIKHGDCIEADTLKSLSAIKNIVAVKDSSGNLELITQFVKVTPDDFKIYSGDDFLNFPVFCLGGVGAVSVASHVAGLELDEMFTALANNDLKRAREIHYSLLDLFKVLFCAPSPAPTKAALKMLGFDTGSVRLPLTDLTENEYHKVKAVIDSLFK